MSTNVLVFTNNYSDEEEIVAITESAIEDVKKMTAEEMHDFLRETWFAEGDVIEPSEAFKRPDVEKVKGADEWYVTMFHRDADGIEQEAEMTARLYRMSKVRK